ncbi:MAG: tyrosine-type recombinase/integrase [Solirubrobacteraceae bacterium]
MAAGIRQRHGRGCSQQGRCRCPYEASVYSKRDGRKIRKTFPTMAAAAAWRDDARGAVRRNTLRAPTATTIAEAAATWLEGARGGVIRNRSGDPYKPSAIRSYEATLRLRILPVLGRVKLGEVTRNDLQDFVDELVASGLNASTVGVTLLPLRAIYKRAVARGDVAVNPTTGLQMPAVRGGRDRIASPDECAVLLEALPAGDRPLWATAMYAGLRRGELMALRIEDVNLASGVIHVRRGWDAIEGEIGTKSGKERRVPIAAVLRDHLDEHLLRLEWREGLVFGSTAVSPFSPTTVTQRAMVAWGWRRTRAGGEGWVRAREDALEPIGLHECRHTFASLMIAAGVNAKALSTYMGHANISITLDRYGHLMPGNEDEAAALLDRYLARASEDAARANLAPVALGSSRIQSDPVG